MNRRLVIEVHEDFYSALLVVVDELFAFGREPNVGVTSAQKAVAWSAVRRALDWSDHQHRSPGEPVSLSFPELN